MNPVLLTFADNQLEAAFGDDAVGKPASIRIWLILICGWFLGWSMWNVFRSTMTLVLFGIENLVARTVGRRSYAWRATVVCVIRILLSGMACNAMNHVGNMHSLEHTLNPFDECSLLMFVKLILVELLYLWLAPIMLKVKFVHHVPLQIICAFIFMIGENGRLCKCLGVMEKKGMYGGVVDFVWAFWDALPYLHVGLNSPATSGAFDEDLCVRVVPFLRVWGGLGVLSYIVWRLEYSSRADFLQAAEQAPEEGSASRLSYEISLCHLCVVVFSGVLVFEVMSWVG